MKQLLLTNNFKLHSARQLYESFALPANTYYVFAGKSTPYANGDSSIPQPNNSVAATYYDVHRNMLFGKKVSQSDVAFVTKRYDWVSGTVYDEYDDRVDLTDKKFYVVVSSGSQYHVFKVLSNNGGAPSIYPPEASSTSPDDEFYSTADGYVWKLMYTMEKTAFEKFASTSYMPVVANNEVQNSAVEGCIDVVKIQYSGSHYNSTLQGIFSTSDVNVGGIPTLYNLSSSTASSNNDFYNLSYIYISSGTGAGQVRTIQDYAVDAYNKTITIDSPFNPPPDNTSHYQITPSVILVGDGSGAVARALVNTASSNSIYAVEVLNRGAGYTYVVGVVQGNTGGVSNAATVTVSFPPPGGHGADPLAELNASALCISTTFSNNEIGTIPTSNDFRVVGLLRDPMYANVELSLTTSTAEAFDDAELVTQLPSGAIGVVTSRSSDVLRLSNVKGTFVSGQIVQGQTSNASANVSSLLVSGVSKSFNTFDQRYRYVGDVVYSQFIEDEEVVQLDAQYQNEQLFGKANWHSADDNYVYLTNLQGIINPANTIVGSTSGAVANLVSKVYPDLVERSGDVLYIENMSPIPRSNNQTEQVKLILKF